MNFLFREKINEPLKNSTIIDDIILKQIEGEHRQDERHFSEYYKSKFISNRGGRRSRGIGSLDDYEFLAVFF